MIDSSNIIDAVVHGRYYKYHVKDIRKWFVYESLHEEGPDVKKKLGQFPTEDEAVKFIDMLSTLLKAYLSTAMTIKDTKTDKQPPTAKEALAILKGKEKKSKNPTGEHEAF